MTVSTTIGRESLLEWYRRNRHRSRTLFNIVQPDAYHSRPISLRHPIVFYEGHLPAFSVNTLVKRSLGRPGVDERLERLFARGIDPDGEASASHDERGDWPSRDEVRQFAEQCDVLVMESLAALDQSDRALMPARQSAHIVLEHEAMHHETMLYMWHQLPFAQKNAPAVAARDTEGAWQTPAKVTVPRGRATLGARRGEIPFGWDNEFPAFVVDVDAFQIDVHNVTNQQFMDFVDAGGYSQAEWWTPEGFEWIRHDGIEHPRFWLRRDGTWKWRGMFDDIDLPPTWPVYVSQAEAAAYARWVGARLPTEAEYHRAAFGTPSEGERQYPWGDAPPDASRGAFDFTSWDPVPVGRRPAGQSAWGVHDLMGNGWEWTSSVFAPFDGFRPQAPYPEYSADFFDGQHVVMKGASPATAATLLRPSFRNWFRPHYPYVYAAFRCVRTKE